ncbi:MAG TPA: glycosyltransferase [Gemmataceae bacterium]|jgi:hypothetical protein
MNILFVTDRRLDAGSIQAVAGYVRAGDELGHTIAVYGPSDPRFPGVRASTNARAFDYVVFLFESKLRWLSGLQLANLLASVPRRQRAILDADGMYNRLTCIENYDYNHAGERDRAEWLASYERLADKIMQPTFAPLEPGVIALPFYGYDPAAQVQDASGRKQFDLIHVGHNWWRWREVSGVLLPAIERIRAGMDGVCFVGLWWDAPPPWAESIGLREAFRTDPERLRALRVQVRPPVPFSQVIATMSAGRVNIMTQRPLFRRFRFLTSKFFEIFCADTIPLVLIDPDHAESVYGPAGRELALHGDIADKLLDALTRPRTYYEIVQEVRDHLAARHSYRRRVEELVAALER